MRLYIQPTAVWSLSLATYLTYLTCVLIYFTLRHANTAAPTYLKYLPMLRFSFLRAVRGSFFSVLSVNIDEYLLTSLTMTQLGSFYIPTYLHLPPWQPEKGGVQASKHPPLEA